MTEEISETETASERAELCVKANVNILAMLNGLTTSEAVSVLEGTKFMLLLKHYKALGV